MIEKTYYDILHVNADASLSDIKKSYINMVKKYHPDKKHFSDDVSIDKFILVKKAYEILSDDKKRLKYDAQMIRTSEHNYQSSQINGEANHNLDIVHELKLSVVDIYSGCSKKLKIDRIRFNIDEQTNEYETIFERLHLRKRIVPMETYTFRGKGDVYIQNSKIIECGNLIINADIQDHKYRIDGYNIIIYQNITIAESIVGCIVDIGDLTKQNKSKFFLKGPINDGDVFTLPGYGLYGDDIGDIHLHLCILPNNIQSKNDWINSWPSYDYDGALEGDSENIDLNTAIRMES